MLDGYTIFSPTGYNLLFAGGIYSLLTLITYFIVKLVNGRSDYSDGWTRMGLYFILYFPMLLVVWAVLGVLTWIGVLPIKITLYR